MFSDEKQKSQGATQAEQKVEAAPAVVAGGPQLNSDVANAAAQSRKNGTSEAPDLKGDGAAPFPSAVPVQITATKLRVRSAPTTSTKKNIVGRYTQGEQVVTFGKEGNWLKVNHEGQEAFIHGRYTKPSVVAPTKPAPTTQSAIDTGAAVATPLADAAQGLVHWFTGLVDKATDGHDEGCDHDDHDDDTDRVKNDPISPVAKDENEPTELKNDPAPVPKPAPAPVPAGAAQLKDSALATYLASLSNGHVDAAAHALAAVESKSDGMAAGADDNMNEEKRGADREALVASLGELRTRIGQVGEGLDEATASKARAQLYRAAQAIAPYYSQGRNMDILETAGNTRTCNLTSLAMCLESLGVGPSSYSGSEASIVAAASVSEWAPRVKKAGGGSSYAALTGLRMPDFLQLCAIAECANGKSRDAMLAGGRKAWDAILGMGFLRKLAARFGVGASIHYFTTDVNVEEKDRGALSSHGKTHRAEAYELILARNKAEQSGDPKDQARYEKLKAKASDVLGTGDSKIDKKLPVETYKQAILSQVGPELDAGKAVVVHMAGHYTRLAEIHDTHIVADDPGSYKKANMKILWEEARALAYFKSRVVLG